MPETEANDRSPWAGACVRVVTVDGRHFGGYLVARNRVATVRQVVRWSPNGRLQVVFPDRTVGAQIEGASPEADAAILLLDDNVTAPPARLHVAGLARGTGPPLPLGEGSPAPGTPIFVGGAVIGHITGTSPAGVVYACPAHEVQQLLAEAARVRPPGDAYDVLTYVSRKSEEDKALQLLEDHEPVVLVGPERIGKSVLTGYLIDHLPGAGEDTYVITANVERFVDIFPESERAGIFFPWLTEQWKNAERRGGRGETLPQDSMPAEAPKPEVPALHLDGPAQGELFQALKDSFRQRLDLEQLVLWGLGESLEAIVGGSSLDQAIFDLIRYTESRGETRTLVNKALDQRPNNPSLRAFAAKHLLRPTAVDRFAGYDRTGPFTEFARDYLRRWGHCRFVFVIEKAGALHACPGIDTQFFGMLRWWHRRCQDEPWSRLSIILEVSTNADLQSGPVSPYNTVDPITVGDLTPDQAREMAARYDLRWDAPAIARLNAHLAGHPYLMAIAMYRAHRAPALTFEEVLHQAQNATGIFEWHLEQSYLNIRKDPRLEDVLRPLLGGTAVQGDPSHNRLEAAGVVVTQDRVVRIRYPIFGTFLRRKLGVRP